MFKRTLSRSVLAGAAALSMATAGLAGFAPLALADTTSLRPELPDTAGTKVLPSPQHNGVGWTTKIVGNIGFVGGEFTAIRPFDARPGIDTSPGGNFVAFDIATGEIIPELSWNFNGPVKDIEVSPDGKKLYVSGMFTRVDNEPRYRFAAFDIASGRVTGPAPSFDYTVEDIAVAGDTIYVGGKFSAISGQPRQNLAAFKDNGQILPWAPRADDRVLGLVVTSDGSKVVAGGQFRTLAGRRADGWGAVDGRSGASLPWQINQIAHVSGRNGGIYDLAADDNGVFGVAFSYGANTRFEGTAAAEWSGQLRWVKGCHGDSYGVAVDGPVVYQVNHNHNCSPVGGLPEHGGRIYQRADAVTAARSPYGRVNVGLDFNGQPAPEQLHWFPEIPMGTFTGLDQGSWSVDAENGYVLIGGEFEDISSRRQQGIALMATKEHGGDAPPAKHWEMNPNFRVGNFGAVTVSFRQIYDRDSVRVTYQLMRDGEVISEKTYDGKRWWESRATIVMSDPSTSNGEHEYWIRAVDPEGNASDTPKKTIKITNAPEQSDYVDLLTSHGATHLWRLDEGAGSNTAYDRVGANHMNLTWRAERDQPGALTVEDNAATAFTGRDRTPAAMQTAEHAPSSYAAEVWFKTTTTKGGSIMAFGSSRIANSSRRDRHIYLNNDGQLLAGVYPLRVRTVKSEKSYNDGQWHHVVAQVGSGGLELFVDGERVAHDATVTHGEANRGYWKLGGESLSGWTDRPREYRYEGVLDEAAIYEAPLSADQIKEHYNQGARAVEGNQPPEAVFTVNSTDRTINVSGAGSTDPDGTVDSYAWDFGDGNTADGAEATHEYAENGSYTVKLTVTDDKGAEDSVTKQVDVAKGGVVVDDPNDGPKQMEAVDEFERTTAQSWGSTDPGGNWTTFGNSANFTTDGEHAVMHINPGTENAAQLDQVEMADVAIASDLTMPTAPTGTVYMGYTMRAQGRQSYSARVKVYSDGTAQVGLLTRDGGNSKVLTAKNVITGLKPGQKLHVKAEAVGNGTTALKAKIWLDGQPEPQWQVEATDSTDALQGVGSVGVLGYLSGSADGDMDFLFDRFAASKP